MARLAKFVTQAVNRGRNLRPYFLLSVCLILNTTMLVTHIII